MLFKPGFLKAADAGAPPSVTDDFNRADENLDDDAAWTLRHGTDTVLQVVSNELESSATGGSDALVTNSVSLSDDQKVTITVTGATEAGGEDITGPIIRWTAGGNDRQCFALNFDIEGDFIRVLNGATYGVLSGPVTFATAESQSGETASYPFDLTLEAIGTQLRVYLNGSEITGLAVTSSAHTTGLAGMFTLFADGSNTTQMDDFLAEDAS